MPPMDAAAVRRNADPEPGVWLFGDRLVVTPKQYEGLRRELDGPHGYGRGDAVIAEWLLGLGLHAPDFMYRQTHIVVDWGTR